MSDMEIEEMLLYSARHGDLAMVRELLDARSQDKIAFDVSCKGIPTIAFGKFNFAFIISHMLYFPHYI